MVATLNLVDALLISIAVAAAFYLVPDVRGKIEDLWWGAIQAGLSEDIKSTAAIVVILTVLAYLLSKFL